ncbi:MAG: TolC family protein, partial [Bdellovibrionales bacterium]|nr:TolC family protein [Bdellovibrionales bacterium]
ALSLILSKEEEARGARAAYLPTISAGANAGYSNEPGRTGRLSQATSGGGAPYGRYQTVGVTVGGTIFDGTRKGNIASADARVIQQQKNLLRVENQIRQDVENAVTRVKASTRILPPALKSYVAAQKALLIRSGKARLGTETGMVFQNLLLQQNLKVMERELTLFQSIVNVLEQEAQLKYATATF